MCSHCQRSRGVERDPGRYFHSAFGAVRPRYRLICQKKHSRLWPGWPGSLKNNGSRESGMFQSRPSIGMSFRLVVSLHLGIGVGPMPHPREKTGPGYSTESRCDCYGQDFAPAAGCYPFLPFSAVPPGSNCSSDWMMLQGKDSPAAIHRQRVGCSFSTMSSGEDGHRSRLAVWGCQNGWTSDICDPGFGG